MIFYKFIVLIGLFFFYCAENLHFYPPEHVIYGDYVFKTWDEQLLKQVLGFFVPENMRVDVVSKSFLKSEGAFFLSRLFESCLLSFFLSQIIDSGKVLSY